MFYRTALLTRTLYISELEITEYFVRIVLSFFLSQQLELVMVNAYMISFLYPLSLYSAVISHT